MDSSITSPPPATSRHPLWRRVLKTLTLHAFILLFVTILPVMAYEAVTASNLQRIKGLSFAGGVTYPLYAIYCITRLRSFQAKFILIHLTVLLVSVCLTAASGLTDSSLIWVTLPTAMAGLPILGTLSSRLRRIQGLVRTCLLSLLLALPIGVVSSLFICYAIGMASIGNMRY